MKEGTRPCRLYLALLLALVMVLTASCGTAAPASNVASSEPAVSASSDSAPAATESAAEAQATPMDPFGKYTPEISANLIGVVDNTVKYPEGQTATDNVWTRAYKDTLGINVKYLWHIDAAQFEQKMNVTIASGALPDIFPVNSKQFNMLMEDDSLEELTGAYDTYAAPLTKDIASKGQTFNLGKVDGKLYGLVYGNSPMDNAAMLFIREDWRTKLSLPEPKTMEDFYKIAEAFVTKDPDANGKADTYALALTQTLARGDGDVGIAGFAGLQGFANAYGAYMGVWIEGQDGKVAYGSIQPEVKPVLGKLQEMYAKGWIDREYAVKDSVKVAESVSAGKTGMEFGMMWNPYYPLQSTVQNDPKADWKAYPVPTLDGKENKVSTSVAANYIWVVKKGYENPEAAVKMVNLFTEKFWGKTADNNMTNGDGVNYVPFKYAAAQIWPETKNYDGHVKCVEALKSGDTSKLNAEETNYFNTMKLYVDKQDLAGWGTWKIFGDGSSFDVIGSYLNGERYLYDAFHGVPTASMVEKGSTLDKMETEVFTKIVLGAPLTEFDAYVEKWKSLGGDTITTEMNASR